MQSYNNNSLEKKSIKKECKLSIDEVILHNQDIFSQLFLENRYKKEKSYISIKEYELMELIENNILALMDKCNPGKLKDILDVVNNKF